MKALSLDAPNVGELEKEYLCKAIDSGFVSTVGPLVSAFEDKFAQCIGAKRAVSTQSGTAALHLALLEAKIGPGDEVIVPALTFVATANAVKYVSATPVFVDVDPQTWTLNVSELPSLVTNKTKAIIPVHLYGNPCDMDAIQNLARLHDLKVIEDATESLGSSYDGKCTGMIGDFGVFSFNGNKVITTGGGGMVVGKDSAALEHIKYLINQARSESDEGWMHNEVGFNYRMTNIEAALGLAQLSRLEDLRATKLRHNEIYRNELEKISSLEFQQSQTKANTAWWLHSIKFETPQLAKRIKAKLQENGVPTRPLFMPIPRFAPYHQPGKNFIVSEELFIRSFSLPSSTLNSDEQVKEVCNALKRILT